MKETIGIIHPGEMGISVAASVQVGGSTVMWASQGRSPQTRDRAAVHALVDAATIENLCRSCSIIISVCPPHAVGEVADQVLACSFKGLYVDVNAISPQKARQISEKMWDQGITFVDGGIIGGPAWEPDSTWLYLSGDDAQRVADCFKDGLLQTEIISTQVGDASSLKMCYAALTKGTNSQRVRRVTAKAWRFSGEMEEIAFTFEGAGQPDGFHRAAAEIFTRMEGFKGRNQPPQLEEVLTALRTKKANTN